VVPDDQLSLGIGRRGQNVRLASQLTGWDIDILTEEEESRRRSEEFRQRSQMFIDGLDVDDVIAHLLVAEGFTAIDQVAYVPIEDLTEIEGFDEEVAEELRTRAQAYLEEQDQQLTEKRRELGVSDDLANLDGLTTTQLVKLGENEVRTLDDLGDLASDELIELLGEDAPGPEEADQIIMSARAHWFDGEPAGAESAGSQSGGSESGGSQSGEARAAGASGQQTA
jgi:N utilization substance protein A